jgi:hypothetical protein
MSALVVVANPANLSEYNNLAPIDVEGETKRARESLGNIPVSALPSSTDGSGERASLNNLVASLRSGEHDILYWYAMAPLAGCALSLAGGR